MSRLPDFLIIGAAKSGTTSLYRYLSAHPQVFMSAHKEPHFFSYCDQRLDYQGPGDDWLNQNAVTDQNKYEQLFSRAQPDQLAGEASTMYLYVDGTAERILQFTPGAKLIAILRNPIDRAYSAFNHLRRDGRETEYTFAAALEKEDERIRDGWAPIWHYKSMGKYYQQLSRYSDFISAGQLKVFLYDDLKKNPDSVLKAIFEFLAVDHQFEVDMSVVYNRSGVPRNSRVHRFLANPHPIKEFAKKIITGGLRERMTARAKNANLVKPPLLDPHILHNLLAYFSQDIAELSKLLRRDLSHWRKSTEDAT